MYNSSVNKCSTSYGSRIFVYEVEGLKQSSATDAMQNSIRKSGSVSITVPYNRMNQEMQRISRMGAKIVSIRPAEEANASKGKQPAKSDN